MNLTKTDKDLLLGWGYSERDFPQIEEALQKSKTKYKLESAQISRDKAISLLGREQFLSGISRSAFHHTAVRQTADGRFVFFDSSNLFR